MSDRHHPTWAEVRDSYWRDLIAEAYAPVPRNREAERTRCEAAIPGYAEARNALADE